MWKLAQLSEEVPHAQVSAQSWLRRDSTEIIEEFPILFVQSEKNTSTSELGKSAIVIGIRQVT